MAGEKRGKTSGGGGECTAIGCDNKGPVIGLEDHQDWRRGRTGSAWPPNRNHERICRSLFKAGEGIGGKGRGVIEKNCTEILGGNLKVT